MKVYFYKKTIDVVFAAEEGLSKSDLLKEAEMWLNENISCAGLENCGTEPFLKEVKSLNDVSPDWQAKDCLIWGHSDDDLELTKLLDKEYQQYLKLKKKFEK